MFFIGVFVRRHFDAYVSHCHLYSLAESLSRDSDATRLNMPHVFDTPHLAK
jgi:hypothetical protein